MRIWLRYEKNTHAKYISHLDFLRAMTRTLKRAGIPVSYSQGFNPHPKLSFALPLPLGTTSITELMEIETDFDMDLTKLIDLLNDASPLGIKFLEAGVSVDKNKFRAIGFSKYKVKPDKIISKEELFSFLSMNEIITAKKTKSGIKDTDIKKDILSIVIEDDSFIMTLAAGNESNLKPETVLCAMKENIPTFTFEDYDCIRTGILDKNGMFI